MNDLPPSADDLAAASMPLGPEWLRQRVATVLAEADLSFSATGDVLDGMRWAQFAMKHSAPIPPAIAAWLAGGIQAWLIDEGKPRMKLDKALKLGGIGPSDPRRRQAAKQLREACLGRMRILHTLGATIDEAAKLVARFSPDFTAQHLRKSYATSGLGKGALQDRLPCIRGGWHIMDVRRLLADYPDNPPEVVRIKNAIVGRYSKRLL